eukprot:gb/GECH01004073.1/.p1 GENE.gb/GECH01004073.1/~~gb/GECH01004073.1/.p1  ORF type:complete len:349 (+),score=72.46 gb/GECH01004073.1/:1-1047(+)
MKFSHIISLLAIVLTVYTPHVTFGEVHENDICNDLINNIPECLQKDSENKIESYPGFNNLRRNSMTSGSLELGDCSEDDDGASFDFGTLSAAVPLPSNIISGMEIENAGAYDLGPGFAASYSLTSGVGLGQAVSGFQFVIPESKAIKITLENDPGENGLEEVSVKIVDVGAAGVRVEAFDKDGNLVDAKEKFGTGLGVGNSETITVNGEGIRSIKVFQPNPNNVDGILIVSINTKCPLRCPGIEIPAPYTEKKTLKYCLVNEPRASEYEQRRICRKLGGYLAEIGDIQEFQYLASRVPETAFVDSWQTDDYGSTCIVFWPGGAITEAPLSCNGPYAGLCEIPIYKKKN